ncbi:MAG TPA: hypothetical protein PLN81_08480 [Bacillota bacterium]|nr:hypothetical protein [Bacillota bacterium]
MTWSYDPNLTTPKDRVRFQIGDTIQTDQLLQDEEINFVLLQKGNDELRAAVECCEVIATKFARQADSTMGKTSVRASQRSKAYTDRAKQLRKRISSFAAPVAGGIESDPIFSVGMMDQS